MCVIFNKMHVIFNTFILDKNKFAAKNLLTNTRYILAFNEKKCYIFPVNEQDIP